MEYEIVITGSSRPDLFKIMWESFHEKVKMKEKPFITVYEDIIIKKESLKVKEYIKEKVDEYIEFGPNRGLGFVLNNAIKNLKAKYFIYLQDDWRFLKEIDIDLLVEIMNENPKIKQIWFSKPHLPSWFFDKFCKNAVEIKGVTLTPYVSWAFLPNITRTDFIKPLYVQNVANKKRPESPFKKSLIQKGIIPTNAPNDVRKFNSCVSYILGKKGDGKNSYLEHLGIKGKETKNMVKI